MSPIHDQLVVRLNDTIVQTMMLDAPVLTIGRSPDTALTLPHPRISRHHAEIRRVDETMVIVDLGSANGILVNGERLQRRETRTLPYGAVVQIGPYTLTCHTPTSMEMHPEYLSDQTIMNVSAELKIHIDPQQERKQVEEITESAFFQRLRDEKHRLRRQDRKDPEEERNTP